MKTLDPAVFERVISKMPRTNEATKQALRRIFVDGIEPATVAREFSFAGGDIYRKKTFFLKAYEKYADAPDGWVTITVTLPMERATEVMAESKRLREGLL